MSLTTLKVGAISCLAVGTFLGVFSAFIPGMEENNLEETSKTESQLTSGNQAKWDQVPGTYGYNVQWTHYLYPNTNYLEVISLFLKFFLDSLQQRSPRVLQGRTLRL